MSTGLSTPTPLQRIQRLADDVRVAYESLLGGETVAAPAELRVLLGEWTAELTAVNERIVHCHELVRRGLRDEAIGRALEEPDLFEAVKMLDLDRFGRGTHASWIEAGRVAGLVAPAGPQFDKMADIEAARDHLTELRPLLEQWRRMNFQRAPLPNRIALLRELEESDPDEKCPVWRAMLVEHESHRLMEIKAHLARLRERFAKERDMDVAELERELAGIQSELRGESSTVESPDDVSAQATRLVVEARQRRVDATLDGLVAELESAHRGLAGDRPAGRATLGRLLDAWNQALAERGVIDPADPRLVRVGPIVAYASLLRQHDALVTEVSQRLSERPSTLRGRSEWIEDLGRMMDRIDDSASRLPSEDLDPRQIRLLSDRVADTAYEVRRESWLRRGLVIVAAVALVVGVMASAVAVYAVDRHRAAVEVAVAACDDAVRRIEAGEDVGANVEAEWPATVRRDERVVAALATVEAARNQHAGRLDSLASLLEDLNTSLAGLHAAERPDPFAPWPEPFAQATAILARLREPRLAVTDEERAKLEHPAATLRTKAQDLRAAADDAFDDRVRRLEARLAEADLVLRDNPVGSVATIDTAIAEAEHELDRLRGVAATAACPKAVEGYGDRKIVSDAAASHVAATSKIVTSLNALRSRLGVTKGVEAREADADRLLKEEKYAEYADAIRRIAEDVSSGGGTGDYTAVARDHAAWLAIAGWHRFVKSLPEPATVTTDEAKATLEKLRAFSPEVTRLHGVQAARSWLEPALERAIADVPEKLEQLRSDFTVILESQHGEGIDAVVWERGTLPYPRYYCLLRDRPLAERWNRFDYVIGRPDESREWPKKQLYSSSPENYEVADSPQKILALACKRTLQAPQPARAAIDRLAARVIETCAGALKTPADRPIIDPCMQAILLRFMVLKACEASPALKSMLVGSQAMLNAGKAADGQTSVIKGVDNEVFTTAVLVPEKQDDGAWIQVQREKCATFVKLVAREAAEASKAIEEREKTVAQRYRDLECYRCVGRLRKKAGGGWTISGGDAAARRKTQLFVASASAAHDTMVPCVTTDAAGDIPAGSTVAARAGDPVWIRIKRD